MSIHHVLVRSLALAFTGLASFGSADAQSTGSVHYRIASDRAIGEGGIGDLVIDPAHLRLYGAGSAVIDLTRDSVVGRLPSGIGHGYAMATDLGRGITRSGAIFDLRTLALLEPSGPSRASSVAYDQFTHLAARDDDPMEIIDVSNGHALSHLPLGLSRSVVSDDRGHFFEALESDTLIVVDARQRAVTRRWSLAGCQMPQGMAIDKATRRLFLSCASARLLVIDYTTGHVVATIPIAQSNGQLAFDTTYRVLLLPTTRETLTVIRQSVPEAYHVVGNIAVGPIAPAVAVDQSTHRVYLAHFGRTTRDANVISVMTLEAGVPQ